MNEGKEGRMERQKEIKELKKGGRKKNGRGDDRFILRIMETDEKKGKVKKRRKK